MKQNARICFRSGAACLTQMDTERDTPESLAQRMVGGGFVICREDRWGAPRVVVINLADVRAIYIEAAGYE